MKKYEFNKKITILETLFMLALCLMVLFFVIFGAKEIFLNNIKTLFRSLLVGCVTCISLIPMLTKHSKRYLVLEEKFIRFKSFHINKKYKDVDVANESIQFITKKFYPNLKGFCLELKTTEYNSILIDATINDSRELFAEICKRAKLANPDVKISKEIIRYLNN